MSRASLLIESPTDAEMLLLGLLAEMPRHGYELEREIERRDLREWLPIGFSSIYFVLGKLERAGLVTSVRARTLKGKRTFTITPIGRRLLVEQTATALRTYRATSSSVLPGMMHWAVLEREQALEALEARGKAVSAEAARLQSLRASTQPLPDFLEALHDFSLGQLAAEAAWIRRTLDYMKTKPWLK